MEILSDVSDVSEVICAVCSHRWHMFSVVKLVMTFCDSSPYSISPTTTLHTSQLVN